MVIIVPNALETDEREWVPQVENLWFRPKCLDRLQGNWGDSS